MPLEVYEAFDPPVRVGLRAGCCVRAARGLNVLEPLVLLVVLGPLLRPKPDDGNGGLVKPPPVVVGLTTAAPLRLGPILVGNCEGFTLLATRLNAVMHCKTWAGSFAS